MRKHLHLPPTSLDLQRAPKVDLTADREAHAREVLLRHVAHTWLAQQLIVRPPHRKGWVVRCAQFDYVREAAVRDGVEVSLMCHRLVERLDRRVLFRPASQEAEFVSG